MIVNTQNENKSPKHNSHNKNAYNNNLLGIDDENINNKNDNNICQFISDNKNVNNNNTTDQDINNNLQAINSSPNQFNKGLKRKHSLKTKYEQEKKSIYTKIAQTKQNQKQSQIIKAQFNPKHLLLVVGIDR